MKQYLLNLTDQEHYHLKKKAAELQLSIKELLLKGAFELDGRSLSTQKQEEKEDV